MENRLLELIPILYKFRSNHKLLISICDGYGLKVDVNGDYLDIKFSDKEGELDTAYQFYANRDNTIIKMKDKRLGTFQITVMSNGNVMFTELEPFKTYEFNSYFDIEEYSNNKIGRFSYEEDQFIMQNASIGLKRHVVDIKDYPEVKRIFNNKFNNTNYEYIGKWFLPISMIAEQFGDNRLSKLYRIKL